MSNNPLTPATQSQDSDSLKSLLKKYEASFQRVLGERTPQFMSSVIQVTNSSRQLKSCKPESVVAAAMTAAVLDLPIDKNLGFAHIVPYGGLAQFQMGYKGIIQLALRSGQYLQMNAKPINAEAFGGFDNVGDPIIKWDKLDETKEEIGYAFAWKLVTGFIKCVYWPKAKVEAHAAKYSQAYKAKKMDSPWFTNFKSMALKTVVKDGISHWGIMSVQMQKAILEDQGAHVMPGDDNIVYTDTVDGDDGPPKMTLPEPKTSTAPATATPSPVIPVEATVVTTSPPDGEGDFNKMATPVAPTQPENPPPSEPTTEPPPANDELVEAKLLVEQIGKLSFEGGVNENQVLAYCQKNKMAGKMCSSVEQMMNSKMKILIEQWPHIVDKIKAYPRG